MYIILIALIVLASILLTLFVLVQNSKGGGLSAGFSSSNQIMGVRKTTDFLEKTTWGLVAFVVVLSVGSVYFNKQQNVVNTNDSEIRNQIQKAKQSEPGVVAPNFGEKPETAPAATPAKK